jgi:hypothetical protein
LTIRSCLTHRTVLFPIIQERRETVFQEDLVAI